MNCAWQELLGILPNHIRQQLTPQDRNTVQEIRLRLDKPAEDANTRSAGVDYVLNTNTHKFHVPGCRSANQIKASNRWDVEMTRDEVIAMGYSPCGNCKP